jgi:hypothetical protein
MRTESLALGPWWRFNCRSTILGPANSRLSRLHFKHSLARGKRCLVKYAPRCHYCLSSSGWHTKALAFDHRTYRDYSRDD